MERTFCKGYTWGFFAGEGTYRTEAAERSMERLASNGLDWICIPVNCVQETFHSLNIFPMFGRTQSDEDVEFAVKKARSLGLKVCLKPMVDCLDGIWRARIDFPRDTNTFYIERWFESYTRFMVHYAKLAERLGCEMLCTGCEMAGMDKNGDYCMKMIEQVRSVYHGLLMHNINHGDELRFSWLGAVDIIGISAYYPVTTPDDNSIELMRQRWGKVVETLEKAHEKYDRPIMFAEVGVRNEHGCTMYPWDFHDRPEQPCDEQEQADFYQSAMEATWDKPWFSGYFWWDWKAVIGPEDKVHENRDFTVYGKQAEKILKEWYSK